MRTGHYLRGKARAAEVVQTGAVRFADRAEAGRVLARSLAPLRRCGPIVLGLPRGGVPVAAEVAAALHADLDVVVVRKVGAPGHAELAVGAVGERGVTVRLDGVLADLGITWADVAATAERERAAVARRAADLRGDAEPPDLADRVVILVDDGIATGATMAAAVLVVRDRGASGVVVAAPVAPRDTAARLGADAFVCAHTPRRFSAVGQWYADFGEVTDAEVRAALGL
ncbi:Putative phosphoribosyl transferase [Actinokineospora sp. UTMC 2448]|nr:Putative phosphoribosyl transferase [Actinokineospora sp. UTMC 2448]